MKRVDGINTIHVITTGKEYHVSCKDGADQYIGDAMHPFRTITQAAKVMKAGDKCVVHSGNYFENVRLEENGNCHNHISFEVASGEKATLNGMKNLISGFEPVSDFIFRAKTDGSTVTFAMYQGKPLKIASFPKQDSQYIVTKSSRIEAEKGTDRFHVVDSKLPDIELDGAFMHMTTGSRWVSFSKEITNYKKGCSFEFKEPFEENFSQLDQHDPFAPKEGNEYFLWNHLNLLTEEDEFYADDEYIYLYSRDGKPPVEEEVFYADEHAIAFDLSGKEFVHIKGFDIIGSQIVLEDAAYCSVSYCDLKYSQRFYDAQGYASGKKINNYTSGHDNIWSHCHIFSVSGDGITVGGYDNVVTECIIHEVNGNANYNAAVRLQEETNGCRVNHCTLYDSGRYLIYFQHAKSFTITHNELYNAGLKTWDGGAMTSYGTNSLSAEIAYNYVHHVEFGDCCVGIYLDNFSRNYRVHHNVVHNIQGAAIRLNSDSLNNHVYNNTMYQCMSAFAVYAHHGYEVTQRGTYILNNKYEFGGDYGGETEFAEGDNAPVYLGNEDMNGEEKAIPVLVQGVNDVHGIFDYCGAVGPLDEKILYGASWELEQN